MSFTLRHKLFNNLDNPTRFLLWTFPEATTLFCPVFIGMGFGCFFKGLLFSVLGFCALRKWQQRWGKQSVHALLYWYLPHNKRKLKLTPPSYIREYLG